ncbi:hypothetical protein AVEN_243629-1 [Araneus ventricosus]|uniref:Transposase Tc1-like domain-containing protein n=1 Tax=Araneus ventricosus TaxID=182803 RepID=A0A4Y2A765_ARAVE|nr:hypothetical protein AVEN_243629-1 [Araneus ventricosus]
MVVADLVKWARQSFGKTISEASTRRYIKRCGYSFYKARRKPFLTSLNKRRRVEWAKYHLRWTHLSGKTYFGQMNPYLRFRMEILAERLLGRRMKQTIHSVPSAWF